MHVIYLLERGLAIGEEQVHSLTGQPGTALRPRQSVASPKQVRAEIFIESFQIVHMDPGNHQHVPMRQGPDVHEGDGVLVFIDKARLRPPRDDVAEDARHLHFHWRLHERIIPGRRA